MLINRNYTKLWFGQTISVVGDEVFSTTLLIWIGFVLLAGQGYAPAISSGVLVITSIVIIFLGPIAGVFVDRWDARRTMLRMDVERHEVSVDGVRIRLALKEFELLEMLLRNAGRVMTRGQLIDRIWGADYVGDTKTLDVHVKRLRSKIEPEPSAPRFLVTVRGLGYKFEP